MKNCASKLFIVNGMINFWELNFLQQLNSKLIRKSTTIFKYLFFIASYRNKVHEKIIPS